jgi:hypothetical protein
MRRPRRWWNAGNGQLVELHGVPFQHGGHWRRHDGRLPGGSGHSGPRRGRRHVLPRRAAGRSVRRGPVGLHILRAARPLLAHLRAADFLCVHLFGRDLVVRRDLSGRRRVYRRRCLHRGGLRRRGDDRPGFIAAEPLGHDRWRRVRHRRDRVPRRMFHRDRLSRWTDLPAATAMRRFAAGPFAAGSVRARPRRREASGHPACEGRTRRVARRRMLVIHKRARLSGAAAHGQDDRTRSVLIVVTANGH